MQPKRDARSSRIARTLGHARITGSHFRDNAASGRVLTKIGFELTGRVVQRWSCARGQTAATIEYAFDLHERT